MPGMPASQQTLLGQAITAVNNWRTQALGVAGGPVQLVQVNLVFPPPAGSPEGTPSAPIVMVWDEPTGQFLVDT